MSTRRFSQPRLLKFLILAAIVLTVSSAGFADRVLRQATVRPGGAKSNPLDQPRDLSGRSIKTPRVRAIHSLDDRMPGSTGWLVRHDPWLAYQRGRELSLREFTAEDGAFGSAGRQGGKTLDDGATLIGNRDHANGCAVCHNTPWRDMGAGAIIAKNGGAGRKTPHLFGGGEIEMIGQEIRRQLLQQADRNHDGWISLDEARQAGRARVLAAGRWLDFGRFDDPNGRGRPHLNDVVYVWYVDGNGKRIPWARSLHDTGVAGYSFEVDVFGFGQRDRTSGGGLGSTLRAVTANAWDIHSGLQPHDPTMNEEPHRDGLARVSLAGAQQFYTGATRDLGTVTGPGGISLDDPDRDGIVEEISEGDLDLIEWFLLNHPAPAERHGSHFETGRRAAAEVGCLECHVPDWRLPGDRRFFRLEVGERSSGLAGRLVRLNQAERTRPFTVRGVYSDFRHHDLGPDFHQMQYDGSTLRQFRTTPLWGVGSASALGHDGSSFDLDAVIRRHGGEAAATTARYAALSESRREALLAFLRGLVLYSTEELPTALEDDGIISEHFKVAGQDTGRETFNPEWLFRIPVRIEGLVTAPDGGRILSRAATNLEEAYGMNLTGLQDSVGDGFADVLGVHDIVRQMADRNR